MTAIPFQPLTIAQWLARARECREDLLALIGHYHPVALDANPVIERHITAPGAEQACQDRKSVV